MKDLASGEGKNAFIGVMPMSEDKDSLSLQFVYMGVMLEGRLLL